MIFTYLYGMHAMYTFKVDESNVFDPDNKTEFKGESSETIKIIIKK